MSETSLLDLLRNDYKLRFSDCNFKRLASILSLYRVEPTKIRIELESNKDNFINNIHLLKKAVFRRNHTEIELEDVIFQLHPIVYGSSEYFDINYPKHVVHKKIFEPDEDQELHQNCAVIRNLSIRARDDVVVDERYTMMIYNENLSIIAGIRFEK